MDDRAVRAFHEPDRSGRGADRRIDVVRSQRLGINIKRRVCVISQKLDTIVDFVLHDLHSGATLNEIVGAYDNTPRREMITIVDKQEYGKLMDFLRKTDPKAFVTVYSVSEMRYLPKK